MAAETQMPRHRNIANCQAAIIEVKEEPAGW
jgi:hypothetical protein